MSRPCSTPDGSESLSERLTEFALHLRLVNGLPDKAALVEEAIKEFHSMAKLLADGIRINCEGQLIILRLTKERDAAMAYVEKCVKIIEDVRDRI